MITVFLWRRQLGDGSNETNEKEGGLEMNTVLTDEQMRPTHISPQPSDDTALPTTETSGEECA